MRNIGFGVFLFLVSCGPFMQTGPEPHSIVFEKNKFDEVVSYFISHHFDGRINVENPPAEISEEVIDKMEDIGFLDYEEVGEYKVFFCGYGVVGKGWGFIYGDFKDEDIKKPPMIGLHKNFQLTYIERLEGKWYRFAVS